MRRFWPVLLLALASAPVQAGDFDAPPSFSNSIRLNPWHVAAAVTDLASSEAMLANGWHEGNPLVPDTGARIAGAALEVAAVAVASGWLESRGHAGAAKWVRWVPVALRFLVSLWNVRLAMAPSNWDRTRWN